MMKMFYPLISAASCNEQMAHRELNQQVLLLPQLSTQSLGPAPKVQSQGT